MSSSIYHGLQSCLEPRIEPWPHGLRVAAPKPFVPQSFRLAQKSDREEHEENSKDEENNNTNAGQGDNLSHKKDDCNNNFDQSSSNGDLGCWSFIQVITNTSQSPKVAEEKESLYVHPLKRSSSKLSDKSLEMCTENLGSETGTDISEDICISSSSLDLGKKSKTGDQLKVGQPWEHRKANFRSFPPPLTSISGSNCVHLKAHREGGRLVIKAVTVPSTQTYFKAERVDGRLKLHFLKTSSPSFDSEAAEEENNGTNAEEEEEEDEDEDEEEQEQEQEQKEEEENEEVEGAEESGEGRGKESDVYGGEEIHENSGNVGGELEIGNLQRRRRCKEGGRGNKMLLVREPCWVATS